MTSSGSYVSTGAVFGRVLVRQRHRPEVSPSTLPLYRGPLLGLLPIARSPTSSTCDCNDALDLSASRVCIVPLHYSLWVTRVRRDVLRAARIPLSRSPRIIITSRPWIPAIHLCHLSGAEHVMGMCTVRWLDLRSPGWPGGQRMLAGSLMSEGYRPDPYREGPLEDHLQRCTPRARPQGGKINPRQWRSKFLDWYVYASMSKQLKRLIKHDLPSKSAFRSRLPHRPLAGSAVPYAELLGFDYIYRAPAQQ